MIPAPVLRRELKAAAGRRDVFAGRLVMAVLLGVVLSAAGGVAVDGDVFERSVFPAAGLKNFGALSLVLLAVFQVLTLAFLVPSLVGGAITEERERQTLPFLLMTRLTRTEVVLAKLAGRLAPAVSQALVGVPFVAFAAYLAGLFPGVAALHVLAVLSTTVTMGAISLVSSDRYARAGNARAAATVRVWGWLILPPALAFLPLPADPFWAALVWLVRESCRWVGTSSPLSLGFRWQWVVAPGGPAPGPPIATMVLAQTIVGSVAFAVAVLGLKRSDPRRAPAVQDALARPVCGDDPIYWREYLLPAQGRPGFRPVFLFRQALTLVRVVLVLLLQLVGVLAALAVPLGMAWIVARLAVPAFEETWLSGPGTAGRDAFTSMIQGVSAFVALASLLGVTSTVAGSVTTEREKGTWLPLLTTPLGGPEIVGGKLRAASRGQWKFAAILLAVWLVGSVCGATHPLGALLGAADFVAAVSLGLGLGVWLAVRPGEPSTAVTASALGALAVTAVHVPYLLVVLMPVRSATALSTLTAAPRAAAWAGLLGVPVASAALAYVLIRRSIERFDRYADRPHRVVAG